MISKDCSKPMESRQASLKVGIYNAILCVRKTACKRLGIQLEAYDGNKEAKSIKCIRVCHAWGFQEGYGYTSAVDQLDGAGKV